MSRNPGFFFVPCLVLALVFFPAPGFSQDPSGDGWEKKSNGKTYNTYQRKAPGSDTAEVKLVGELDASPAEVFAAVTDYAGFPKFMPYIDYTKVVQKEGGQDGKSVSYVFFYVEPPLIAPRYYTLKLVDEKDPDGQAGCYRSAWEQDTGKRRVAPSDPGMQGLLKNAGDAVETRFNKGCWHLRPMPGGHGTQVTYYVWSDPGGNIPSWIANKANTVALPKLWNALAERLGAKN